ncbi:MarR family transcriptional regulator [Leucobacter sp. NPDC077196]|uniref:MarR family winged helix-turn-helix transcriptional regulator n=1 Tax=Leucobacter sp. NPDC077196 TaxID=3154959 RepID=UPI003431C816
MHGGSELDGERDAHMLALMRAVRGFGDAHDRMSAGMKQGMEMNASDLAALRLLIIREEEGRPVSPRDLSAHLRISTASTTKLLDRLSASGHVRRAPHPSDRRARVIELTDAARQEFFKRFGAQLFAMRDEMAQFSTEELAVAERAFRAMGSAIDLDD